MSEKERMDDAGFVHEILNGLPTTRVPAALEARILADFDRLALSPAPAAGLFARLGERLWPGAPAWQPASILALSLAMGLMAGTFVPSQSSSTTTSDQVIVAALDSTPDMDLDRDP